MDHDDGDGDGDGDGACHDGGVDGDSGGRMEKTSGGDSGGVSPLRSSPAAAFCLSVSSFVFLRRPLLENIGGLFLYSFLGHEEASGRRINANGATSPKRGGPTWPGTGAVWGTPFRPSGLHFFSILLPNGFFLQNNDPRKFSAHLDVVWDP